ncbi:MAG: hypothetical protein ACLQBD_18050 [Syntrophobacteraceae bacterium]
MDLKDYYQFEKLDETRSEASARGGGKKWVLCGTASWLGREKRRFFTSEGMRQVFPSILAWGRIHGIERGSELLLLDSKWRPLGQIRVETVSDTDGVAKVNASSEARPGCLVKRIAH